MENMMRLRQIQQVRQQRVQQQQLQQLYHQREQVQHQAEKVQQQQRMEVGVNMLNNSVINQKIYKHLNALKDCNKTNCMGFLQAVENALDLCGSEYEENTLQFSMSHINSFKNFSRVIMNNYLPIKTLTQVKKELSN
jgi:hypothetical protein